MQIVYAKLLSGKEFSIGPCATVDAFLHELLITIEHQSVVKIVVGDLIVNENLYNRSAVESWEYLTVWEEMTIILCKSNGNNNAKIYQHRDYCMEHRPWKKVKLENGDDIALPRYLQDMLKTKEPKQLAWGLQVPCTMLAPTFCNHCFVLTSQLSAYTLEWRQTKQQLWYCMSCQKGRPKLNCSKCERPIWPEDEDLCGEKLGDDSDDEPDIWCPRCVRGS